MKAYPAISRRSLLLGSISTAAVAAMPAQAQSPAGMLRLAGPTSGIASLDPALARDLDTNFLVRQIFRGMMGFDNDLRPVPELASDVAISGDHLAYTFRLRDDATFHDGRRIRAADVVASLARAMNPATANGDRSALAATTYLMDIAGAADLLAGRTQTLAGATAIDEATVRLRLDAPRATFLMKLASVTASVVDVQQATSSPDWWKRPNGTGPFKVVSINPGSLLKLAPVATWRGQPIAVAGVEVLLGASSGLPFNLYQADKIDIVPSIPDENVAFAKDPNSGITGTLTSVPQFAFRYLAFGNTQPPLDDPHLRRALALAFPATNYATITLNDLALPAHGVIPPGMLGQRDWSGSIAPVDVGKARTELAASRYGAAAKVPPIEIYAADAGPAETFRDVVGPPLGLDIRVVELDFPDFLTGLARRQFPAYSLYWGADYPDPESILQMLWGSGSPDNYTGYSNAAFNRALTVARAELDEARRGEQYRQAQQILLDDHAVIPLMFDVAYALVRPGVHGARITPMGLLGLEQLSMDR
jgi:ABC-type transport system substrate-binding protein